MSSGKAVSKHEIRDGDDYTIERTVDELYLCLMTVKDDLYYKQAYALTYLIPVYRPRPVFEIKIADLNEQVKRELDTRWNDRRIINYILKEAVGRIFECVEEKYFFLSVKRLLQVRLVP
jgi:hypothetical protein